MDSNHNCWLIKINNFENLNLYIKYEIIGLDININLLHHVLDDILSNLKYIDNNSSNSAYLHNEYNKLDIKYKENVAIKIQEINNISNHDENIEKKKAQAVIQCLDRLKKESLDLRKKMRDFDKFEKQEKIKDILKSSLFYLSDTVLNLWIEDIFTFIYKININDIIIVPTNINCTFIIGIINGIYEYDANSTITKHKRKVNWIVDDLQLNFLSKIISRENIIIPLDQKMKNEIIKNIKYL